ncbi:MAG: D-aminoacylase [Candidatus Latescibacter sp.]|nr:D-aminoacylase [Candidatus Latescibacter sp.]
MKRRTFLQGTVGGAVFFSGLILGCASKKEYDLLITGGVVYDGTGSPGREMDVAVKGDRIVKIARKISKDRALDVIEAAGMAVAPGFIDPHTHTDVHLLANPKGESKIHQGVTTEIGGNCGFSHFPLSDRSYEETKKNIDREFSVEVTWRDMKGFMARLEQGGTALNFGTLLGQGKLRDFAMGPNDRPPAPAELEKMKAVVREYIQAGALGLSTGLIYVPGSFAKADEITELCREAAKLGGVYATHMRSEEEGVLDAIDETLTTARDSGVNLEIAHLKANYPRNWSKIDQMLPVLEKAAREGIPLQADRYPYIASATGLDSFFPQWAREGTTADFMARLRDKSLDGKLRQALKEKEARAGAWDKVVISSVLLDKNRSLEGKNILQASAEAKKSPYNFMRDLLLEEENHVSMVHFGMCEENLKRFLAHPLVIVGSDGCAAAPYGVLGKGKPHPRFYGTFPRVLGKYVREEKVLTLPEAVKKMTSLAALKFGLAQRGKIAEGYFADLVVFNPDMVIDKATFENPHQYPEGIPHVVVNGQRVINNGEHTGKLPGKILRKV